MKSKVAKTTLITLANILGTDNTHLQEKASSSTNNNHMLPEYNTKVSPTSEGGGTRKKNLPIKPLTDAEFEALLKSIPQRKINHLNKIEQEKQNKELQSRTNKLLMKKSSERLPNYAKNILLKNNNR